MEKEYNLFMDSVTKYDPKETGELEGPHFNTKFWEEDFSGIHPVDMLAKIATFQSKPMASYEPYKIPIRNKQKDFSYNKVIRCIYDGFESFGNGKIDKQAKLVAARNMVVKLKKVNIGVVNETLAAGVKPGVDPHKKPITEKFKMFRKAGDLGSFVTASSNSDGKTGAESAKIVNIQAKQEKEKMEYAKFKACVDNDYSDEQKIALTPVTSPKVLFKRAHDCLDVSSISDGITQPDLKLPRKNSESDNSNYCEGSQRTHNTGTPSDRGSFNGSYGGFVSDAIPEPDSKLPQKNSIESDNSNYYGGSQSTRYTVTPSYRGSFRGGYGGFVNRGSGEHNRGHWGASRGHWGPSRGHWRGFGNFW